MINRYSLYWDVSYLLDACVFILKMAITRNKPKQTQHTHTTHTRQNNLKGTGVGQHFGIL